MSNEKSVISRALNVFLCHISEDKPTVLSIYNRLRADGVKPWLDEKEIMPGQDWDTEIRRAVRKSDVILVCLSQTAVSKSGYIQKEIRFALDVADEKPDGTIFIIPVKLENCEVPERLCRWQWVNYLEEQGYEKIMRALRIRATECRLSSLPGDGSISAVTSKRIPSETGRLIYKTVDIQELLRQAKDGVLHEDDLEILPSSVVVGISHEAMADALERFNNEVRRDEEKQRVLRLVGIRKPYHEWQELNTKIHCFRSEEAQQEVVVQRTLVSSSTISSIGYDPQRRVLEVEFHSGSLYHYFDIPEHLYQGLMSASSHGRYLDANIKKAGFAYQQIR